MSTNTTRLLLAGSLLFSLLLLQTNNATARNTIMISALKRHPPSFVNVVRTTSSSWTRNHHRQHLHRRRYDTLLLFRQLSSSRKKTTPQHKSPSHRLLLSQISAKKSSKTTLSSEDDDGDDAVNNNNNSLTLADGSHVSEMEIKKSRFIAYAKHVTNWKDAQEYIQQIKTDHPKCRHACVGFVCGTNPQTERSNDDGEPTGTAGQPILNAIKGEGLSDVVCVVVRYFGGIKLGAGGLIRAYGNAARLALRDAPKDILIPTSSIRVCVQSQYSGTIYDSLRKVSSSSSNSREGGGHGHGQEGVASDESYDNNGNLIVTLTCESVNVKRLLETLNDATKGTMVVVNEDEGN